MSAEQLCEFSSAFLSIVLSHLYQKKDLLNILAGTNVDFTSVRDVTKGYSKFHE